MTADVVAWLTAELDRAERDAEQLRAELWWVDLYDRIEAHGSEGVRQVISTSESAYRALIGCAANTLRRVAADRKILAEHANDGYSDCVRCADDGFDVELGDGRTVLAREAVGYPCRTVRLLAEAWGWEQQ